MYSLYWSSLPEVDDGTCTAASENATLRENPNCLFWSACGLENAADGHTDWLTLEPNAGHVFEVNLLVVQASVGTVGNDGKGDDIAKFVLLQTQDEQY